MISFLKLQQTSQQLKQIVFHTSTARQLCVVQGTVKSVLGNSSKNCQRVTACRHFTQFSHTGKTNAAAWLCRGTKPVFSKRSSFLALSYRSLSQLSSGRGSPKDRTSVVLYIGAAGIFMLGLGYAGVPLYRMFCQATGYGGSVMVIPGHDTSKVEGMQPIKDKKIMIKFNADTASSMQWKFRPQQPQVELVPGETALAFYTAENPTDKPVIGISTYNVIPFEAGIYFNKIQCFCFEEQRLNPHEQVDMPVFFFIDPDFAEDPKMEDVEQITLSYTFFEAKEGMTLPMPGYMRPIQQPQ